MYLVIILQSFKRVSGFGFSGSLVMSLYETELQLHAERTTNHKGT